MNPHLLSRFAQAASATIDASQNFSEAHGPVDNPATSASVFRAPKPERTLDAGALIR